MKILHVTWIVAALTLTVTYPTNNRGTLTASPYAAAEAGAGIYLWSSVELSSVPNGLSRPKLLPRGDDQIITHEEARREDTVPDYAPEEIPPKQDFLRREARVEDAVPDGPDRAAPKQDFSYLAYYAYAEIPPDKKPADTVLESLKDVPIGTPLEEIKRASDALGLDFAFMRTVAKVESDFDPKQRTGSYIGLFQLSNSEFAKYGSGKITNARDNAVAAAYKFAIEAKLFELDTHRKPTLSDLYLIHQQGWQGAAEHISRPDRIAWESMCATDEGREKGEKWCKLAIWGNTLPTIKHIWKSVNKLTSGAFVDMWRERIDHLYARYSEATPAK